jgi:hypothetical protein
MKWLAELPEQDFKTLQDKVTSGGPIQSRTQLADRIQNALPEIPDSRGTELVREIFSLLNLHFTHDWPIDEIAAQGASSKSLSLNDEQQEALRRRLIEAVSIPLIVKLAKASEIYGEHQNLFHFARIVSDIRPIPDDSPDSAIIGAIITHTLRLNYHTAHGREDLYVALDDKDLEDLGKAVERAKRETRSLEKFIKSADLTDFTGIAE